MIENTIYNGVCNNNHGEFQCTSLSDIDNLPTQTKTWNGNTTSTGSLAIVEEDFSIWLLSISGQWIKWI